MDFTNYRPWILCIESTVPGTDIPDYEKWEKTVLSSDYKFVGMLGINRYYVASERIDVIERFQDLKGLEKLYVIVSYERYKKYEKHMTKWDAIEKKIYPLANSKILSPAKKPLSAIWRFVRNI